MTNEPEDDELMLGLRIDLPDGVSKEEAKRIVREYVAKFDKAFRLLGGVDGLKVDLVEIPKPREPK